MSRMGMEREYITACGRVAKFLALGDTRKLDFWVARRDAFKRDLGL